MLPTDLNSINPSFQNPLSVIFFTIEAVELIGRRSAGKVKLALYYIRRTKTCSPLSGQKLHGYVYELFRLEGLQDIRAAAGVEELPDILAEDVSGEYYHLVLQVGVLLLDAS
jgi:hypothetical protein